jgi:hypothetical protein
VIFLWVIALETDFHLPVVFILLEAGVGLGGAGGGEQYGSLLLERLDHLPELIQILQQSQHVLLGELRINFTHRLRLFSKVFRSTIT